MGNSPHRLIETLREVLSKPLGDSGGLRMTAALQGRHPADVVEALIVFVCRHNTHAAKVLGELALGIQLLDRQLAADVPELPIISFCIPISFHYRKVEGKGAGDGE